MDYNRELITIFKYNHLSVNENLKDVTQQESLSEPESGGNSINWILGHIIVNREGIMNLLGLERKYDEKMDRIYLKTSHIKDDKESVEISSLLKLFNDSQEIIINALSSFDPGKNMNAVSNIAGYAFHESYHTGQLGLLRRVIGKEGKHKFE
jgi:uncharacterized damage-inducible protein DinB